MGSKLGIDDPEQWLEDCPKRVYDRWQAAYQLNPFGGEQELLARIASLLYLLACDRRESDKVMEASNKIMRLFMPRDWIGQQQEKQVLDIDPDQIQANLTAMQGVLEKVFQ